MMYRGNLGCLWIFLLIMLVGGMPLLVGVLRLFLVFGLILVAAGTFGTWWLRRNAVRLYTSTQSERHNRFVGLLVQLLVRLAELDGGMDRSEVAAIRSFFQERLGYKDERLLWLRDLIKEARNTTTTMEELCAGFSNEFGLQERLTVMQVLGQVAQADGQVSPAEAAFLEKSAQLLGLAPFMRGFGFGGRGHHFGGQAGPSPAEKVEEALAVLGLESGTDAAAIKSAWRQLSKENHPDRVTHLGEEFRTLAEERMRKINAAYDTLKEAGLAS
jgi:DnaJ like chaperone protein